MTSPLTQQQVFQFSRDGYLVLPKAASEDQLVELNKATELHREHRLAPLELEADVAYPGAPVSVDAKGGDTIRRLRGAYERDKCFRRWAENDFVTQSVRQLLRSEELYLNQNHHNCVMTKEPEFSSKTNWHRDTRYWSFNNKYLINSWLALGNESYENGGMLVLPGSHRWDLEEDALDEAQFMREDFSSNRGRLALAQHIDLNAGDCLLFSAHCFHAAGQNKTNLNKFSLVFTYHGESTHALPNTNSAKTEPVKIL